MSQTTMTVYYSSGECTDVPLTAEHQGLLSNLQKIVGGFVEVIPLPHDRYMIVNEDGKSLGLELNHKASLLAAVEGVLQGGDYIVGNAVLVPRSALK